MMEIPINCSGPSQDDHEMRGRVEAELAGAGPPLSDYCPLLNHAVSCSCPPLAVWTGGGIVALGEN